MKITYLTTNKFKLREAELILRDKYGIDIEAMNPDFEIYEIQAKTCAEVAGFSARYAADKLGKPCLKSDTGMYVEALGGLPGPYNAYFDKQIGTEKFLKMLADETNRKASIEHCFAYCEPGGEPVIFTGGSTGTISHELRGNDGRWHDFFYIPDGETRTLAEIGDEDPALKASYYGNAIDDLAEWLKEREKRIF
ncbi:non-canonical purine NTP pyrophosphatase [Candidatus Saccharibacteria bacterium]|nr:non-canonical purine NTP pyrophosphatase [Candidatus Saccharibacteria bacterium]